MESLKRKSDFRHLQEQGKRFRPAPWFLVNYLPNDIGHLRLGFTIPAKVGKAVLRNRLRRWSREHLRQKPPLGIDANFIFLKAREPFLYRELRHEDLHRLLEKAYRRFEQEHR